MAKLFFSTDGSWGDAEGISIVDTDGLSNHFVDYAESVREYSRTDWSAWFVDNNHDNPEPDNEYGECYYCENFEVGSLSEIDAWFKDEEDED